MYGRKFLDGVLLFSSRVQYIFPLDEYALVEEILDQHVLFPDKTDRISQMEYAANDHIFIADLRETMSAYKEVDAEWGIRNAVSSLKSRGMENVKRDRDFYPTLLRFGDFATHHGSRSTPQPPPSTLHPPRFTLFPDTP